MSYLIKLGLINFTNCLPLNYTIEKWQLDNVELVYGNPAQLNKLMAEGKIDVAPISSIEYIRNKDKYTLIETACISSDNECGSVILFSNQELSQIKNIALPCDSATSVTMLKIMMKERNINYSNHDYGNVDLGSGAALFIGDNALRGCEALYKYDIGKLWRDFTGLPPVFGTWVRKNNGSNLQEFDDLIQKAIETGFELYFNEIVAIAAKNLKIDEEVIRDYLTSKIKYSFTERHKASLEKLEELYTNYCSTHNTSSINKD